MPGLLRSWHRRLGLVVGIPCLLWGISGGILAWKQITTQKPPGNPERIQGKGRAFVVPVEKALALVRSEKKLGEDKTPLAIRYTWLLQSPRYEIEFAEPTLGTLLVDGEKGVLLADIDETMARRIAEVDGDVPVAVRKVEEVSGYSLIYRPGRELPAYRVHREDGHDVYISKRNGQITAHVDDTYRLLRVAFFALHLWDFSISPPPHRSYYLLLSMAAGLGLLGVSGLWLYGASFVGRNLRRRASSGDP